MSNTSDFILNKEDHTLGNLLSEHLKLHPNVYMAGYKRALPLPCRRASFSYLVLTADLRRPQSATPTYHSCSSGCRPTAPRRRARSFAPCARSSSTSSSPCTKSSRASGSCAASQTSASRATCKQTATERGALQGEKAIWRWDTNIYTKLALCHNREPKVDSMTRRFFLTVTCVMAVFLPHRFCWGNEPLATGCLPGSVPCAPSDAVPSVVGAAFTHPRAVHVAVHSVKCRSHAAASGPSPPGINCLR